MTVSGSHMFQSILSKTNRLPPMSNINDCTKFEDIWSKQSGLRAHTSFKMGGGHLGKKADINFFQKVFPSPLTLKRTQKNLSKTNRLPPMSNINDCTKFEDIWSKQSGLRAHTSFKMGGGHLGNKADINFFQKVFPSPLTLKRTQKNLKVIS